MRGYVKNCNTSLKTVSPNLTHCRRNMPSIYMPVSVKQNLQKPEDFLEH